MTCAVSNRPDATARSAEEGSWSFTEMPTSPPLPDVCSSRSPSGQRGVDEVDAFFHRPAQRAQALRVLGADPQALADAPGPVADLGDHEPRAPQPPVVHCRPPTLTRSSNPGGPRHRRLSTARARGWRLAGEEAPRVEKGLDGAGEEPVGLAIRMAVAREAQRRP